MDTIERLSQSRPGDISPLRSIVLRLDHGIAKLAMSGRPPKTDGQRDLLNLGCGFVNYEGWVNADNPSLLRFVKHRRFRPNWLMDCSTRWNCDDDHWDGIFTEHVLEHLSYAEAVACLREARRTMKPGAWIRICVPGLDRRLASGWQALNFRSFAEAISDLAQSHGHRSVWDAELLGEVLRDVGFRNVAQATFGDGADPSIVKDQEARREDSIYVEGQK